jgi:hypothetical protein
MKHIEARFAKSKYVQISELGSRFNLSFSSQLVLGNKLIALDGLKKCLLILETGAALTEPCLIDLHKVVAVAIKKSYRSINQGELKSKDIEEFVKRIELQFEFTNKEETIVLPFYDIETDEPRDRPTLARNAKNWQMILSRLAGSQTGKIKKEQEKEALAQ